MPSLQLMKKKVQQKISHEHIHLLDVILCMPICIHQKELGTAAHLICGDEYTWSKNIPEDAWVFGNYHDPRSIDIIMKYLGTELPTLQDDAIVNSFKALGYQTLRDIPWHHVLPQKRFYNEISNIIKECGNALESFESLPYCGILQKEHSFLVGLSRAAIDENKLASYTTKENNPTVLKTLATFRPMQDGLCKKSRYDQLSTSTGRTTISSGPQILTLSKKYRDVIKSSSEGGLICQIDFVSLEPRIARKLSGNPDADDVYVDICNTLFAGKLSRDEAKLAVLCALYGVSSRRLSNMLSGKLKAREVIRSINRYFGTYSLIKNINDQLKSGSTISNFFGRELVVENKADHVLISHFIQSTAVDVALLGFHDIDKELKSACKSYKGLFTIHDALIVDIAKEDYDKMVSIVSSGVDVHELGNFPLSLEVINDGR